jgi:hypothetical protein
MSGWWLKLNDIRVNCNQGDGTEPWLIANAIANLYDVPNAPCEDQEDLD